MEWASPVTETLKLAHAALLRIRTASIAGCEEGYGKPEKWADELFTSHGDVTKAMKAIEEILSSGLAQTPAHDATELLRHWQRVADKLQNDLRTSAGFETRASELAFKTFANVRQKTELALSDSSTHRTSK